jgi:hypothetical protein
VPAARLKIPGAVLEALCVYYQEAETAAPHRPARLFLPTAPFDITCNLSGAHRWTTLS